MSYAIIRNVNYKLKNLAGIYRHNERKNTHYSNGDIDKQKSKQNYSIKAPYSTYEKMFRDLREKQHLKGMIKKVSNVMCEFVITSDKLFFDQIGEKETKRYFQTAYNFVASYNNLGEEFIVSAKVHLDESTPHLHILFVPVVHKKDKAGNQISKVACSEYWKGKDSYRKLQDNFYKHITKAGFHLERGNSKENTHIPIETLKSVTNYNNIKYEIENEKIEALETHSQELILAQNRELLQYTNNLKIQLAKSYTSIQKAERLQNENNNLMHENRELKKENYNLKNYIEKIFEVGKGLFDIPINKFKHFVNSFVEYIEK